MQTVGCTCCWRKWFVWYNFAALLFISSALTQNYALWGQTLQLPNPEIIAARQGLPQSFVPAIVQDRLGFIWMATRDGLCRYDGYKFRVFQPPSDGQPGLSSPGLTNLQMAPDGRIWISTDQRDLDLFDPVRETFLNVSRQPYYRQNFGRDTLESVHPDHQNRLWLVFRRHGVVRFDLRTHRFSWFTHQPADPHSLASNMVNDVLEDSQNKIWIATQQGLDRYDEQTERFYHFRYQPGQPQTLPENEVNQLYLRANGEFWLFSRHNLCRWDPQTGRVLANPLTFTNQYPDFVHQIVTDSQGNDYILINRQILRYTGRQELQPLAPASPSQPFVGLFIDQSDVLWAGTDLAGVYKFNLRATPFVSQPYHRSFQSDLLTDWLGIPTNNQPASLIGTSPYDFRATTDSTHHLWFTLGNKAMYRVEGQTLQSVPFPVPLPDYKFDRPTPLATDPAGQIWVVHPTWSGYYKPDKKQWIRFPHPLQPAISSAMLQLVVDQQYLWIATAGAGLYRVNRNTGRVDQFNHHPRDITSLSSNNLYWLSADPLDSNLLWIGTFGSGLCRFDKRTSRCQRFTTQQGLPNNVIYAAIPDRLRSIWIATNQGLGQLDRPTGQIRVYTQEDGLNADEFNRFHALRLPRTVQGSPNSSSTGQEDNGTVGERIVLGGIHGITSFDPARIRMDTFQPRVQLTDVLVNNRPLSVRASATGRLIHQLMHLRLLYNQNFLTFQFAAMQYNRLGRTQYRYQLVRLDSRPRGTYPPEAIYTTLPPGSYQFRVQAANTAGQWSRNVYELAIVIESPWWQAWWAWLGYALIGAGLLWGLIHYRTQQIRNEQILLNKQREAEQLRTVDEVKTRFFANITHEFRTPLTLILSPLETLIADLRQSRYGSQLALIERNAQQLLGLLNQLLELTRLDAHMMPLTMVHGRPDEVVARLLEGFTEAATQANVALVYQHQGTSTYRFDSDKLTRIVTNLVANALKYTSGQPNQLGRVMVSLQTDKGLQLTIADTGIGIAPEHLAHLFDRFYQIENEGTIRQTGSGIGLALVKELVDLQQGSIQVESQLGKGTTFRVSIPYQPVIESNSTLSEALPEELIVDSKDTDAAVILLVEDSEDMAQFISQVLSPTYKVHYAVDGLAGLELARQLTPDLIISDVIMPRMDGYVLCQHLKTDPDTDHIPIIMLTAKVSFASRMQGLQLGADEYLDKPFHVAELQLRVGNLLATQRRFREQLQADLHSLAASPKPVHPFLQTLYQLLDEHLDDARFGAEELAQLANMSRMQLYRKLKSLAGLPATDFIREYRLKQSVALLQQGLSVSQTAYSVGFESPSYFGQCFRQQFGQPPSQFIAKSME